MKDYLQPREWKLRETSLDPGLHARLVEDTGLLPLTVRICMSRGLESREAILEHLSPRLEKLTSPDSIRDMDRAVARLAAARAANELVWIFGDYDVDGTTGTALLSRALGELGLKIHATQPHRFKDGYGLNPGAVEQAHAQGAGVLVTVDCGISSFDAAEKARELGVDLIVVDHHQIDPERGLPTALAVLNPQRADCPSGLRQLCGCGLAFYLALALRAYGRRAGWFEGGTVEPNLRQHLDLVVMATAADMVPLTGDNHILIRHGMEVLKTSRKPGVRALLDAAGASTRDISPSYLGFLIGPRINASGRMQSASLALELLTTEDAGRAARLAGELETLNKERAELQNRIWDQVRARVEEGIAAGKFRHGVVVADAAWHEGVVGIVASRVTETFRRPAAIIAIRGGEDAESLRGPGGALAGKGSVRSYGGKDVLAALRISSEFLLGFGGHRHAAGLSLEAAKVEAFAAAFDHALGEMEEDAATRPLLLEGICRMEDLDVRAIEELERLGPFGPGNHEPVFVIEAGIQEHQVLKGRHLKLRLGDTSKTSRGIEAIWFNAAEREDVMERVRHEDAAGDYSWAGVPELNRFRGRTTPTLRIRDFRLSGSISGSPQKLQ